VRWNTQYVVRQVWPLPWKELAMPLILHIILEPSGLQCCINDKCVEIHVMATRPMDRTTKRPQWLMWRHRQVHGRAVCHSLLHVVNVVLMFILYSYMIQITMSHMNCLQHVHCQYRWTLQGSTHLIKISPKANEKELREEYKSISSNFARCNLSKSLSELDSELLVVLLVPITVTTSSLQCDRGSYQ